MQRVPAYQDSSSCDVLPVITRDRWTSRIEDSCHHLFWRCRYHKLRQCRGDRTRRAILWVSTKHLSQLSTATMPPVLLTLLSFPLISYSLWLAASYWCHRPHDRTPGCGTVWVAVLLSSCVSLNYWELELVSSMAFPASAQFCQSWSGNLELRPVFLQLSSAQISNLRNSNKEEDARFGKERSKNETMPDMGE